MLRALAALAGGVIVAAALTACGTGGIASGSADVQNGKRLFLGKGQCAGVPACGVQAASTAPATTSTAATATGGGAAKPDGKQVFESAGCGACHTFAPAAATGKVGPVPFAPVSEWQALQPRLS